MNDQTPTPRTDAEEKRCGWPAFYFDFARQLERELAAANEKINEDRIRCQEKDLKIIQLSLSEDKWRKAVENIIEYCEGDITYGVNDIHHIKKLAKELLKGE